MGQIFCALVLLLVIFSVDARSARRNSGAGDALCSQDHPLYPYIKLFNDIPAEWKSEDGNFKDKKPVCFTRTMTTEIDDNGKEINSFSSYEITFGLPKKYKSLQDAQPKPINGQEFVNYPPLDEIITSKDKITKNVVYIRCSTNNEDPNTSSTDSGKHTTRKSETTLPPEQSTVPPEQSTVPPEKSTVNHDIDFLNDLDDICEENLDIDIINTLTDGDATPEPDSGNTRRNGDVPIDYTTDKPEGTTIEATVTDTPTEFVTTEPKSENNPNIMPRMDEISFAEVTTEISNLITQIIEEMNTGTTLPTTIPTTIQKEYTVSFATLIVDKPSPEAEPTIQPEISTQKPVTEEIRKSDEQVTEEDVRKSNEQVTEGEARKSTEQVTEKDARKSTEQVTEEDVRKSIEQVTEEDVTKSIEPVTEEEVRKSTEQVTEEDVRKSNEEVTKEDDRKSGEPRAFIIQMKNIVSPNSHAECYLINSKIKYGKCAEPIIPIRILTESKLPTSVDLELEQNLERNRDFDEIIVSGRTYCYLLKNMTSCECPANHDDMATILEIEDLPENPHDDPYVTIEMNGRCTSVSKHVDVIECPVYTESLPHLETDHLPDHVRLKHNPGLIDVHVDDIIVHSYTHCLLLRAIHDMECREKPSIVLKEEIFPEQYRDGLTRDDSPRKDDTPREDDISREYDISREDRFRTTDIVHDEEGLPNYRIGDYSLEQISYMLPKAADSSQESEEPKDPSTTPCDSDEEDNESSDQMNRTTRTLPHPTTESPIPDIKSHHECEENDINCLTQKIIEVAEGLKSRRTIKPLLEDLIFVEMTTPISTTIKSTTEVTEITIPNSRTLSKLLKTIIEESANEPMPRSSDLFKPDFIIKIACADQISKSTCFYVSKYVMQPTFDDPHDYNYLIDESLLPVDAKIVPAPNLNIFEANETIHALSGKIKYVLIKKELVDCPANPKDAFFVLDTGSCAAERREISTVKYLKGRRVYCFDFDDAMRLNLVKCPEDLTKIPVLSRPQDLKTLCRKQLQNKGHNEQMKLLKRLNIVTDY